ncbi:MAG: archease [Planctomycetota bacterium]|jgi:tRNA nucleotidyltransferase (CCA-adding enzyme)
MNQEYWEHYSHPSDMGIRGFGKTIEQAFSQAALALIAVMTNLKDIEATEKIEIECEQADEEMLLFAWLNALIFEIGSKNMFFSKFEITLNENKLQAKVWGEKIDPQKHQTVVEVKAVTYADLKVEQNRQGLWIAQCIVDV